MIVPAWNAEGTLRATLESAAAQTYRNIEIIIVDDGSTDGTVEIADEFCRREARARLLRQDNDGRSSARNRAIAQSHGAWIAPLDSDDIWHPTKIEKQVAAALAAPAGIGFVYCWYQDIDQDDRIVGSGPRPAFSGAAFKRLAYANILPTGLFSRAAVEAVGGYDKRFEPCEDVRLHLAIARRFPVEVLAEHLQGYRQRPPGISRDDEVTVRAWTKVLDQLAAEGADLTPRLRRWVDAQLYTLLAEYRLGRRPIHEVVLTYLAAVRRDPIRWGGYGAYRLLRTAVRLVRGRRPPIVKQDFYSTDPRTLIIADPDELAWFRRLLEAIDDRRLRRLARSEALTPLASGRPMDSVGVRSAGFHRG